MELLSVVIITYNEEQNIGRCIDSVKTVADEVVVLDSFSNDSTVAIARSKGAKVFQHPFTGYVAQKNKALEYASNDYVLSLDADEELNEELMASIGLLKDKKGFAFKAYKMNRCAFYCGKFIKHGAWYPETKVRLFDKRVVRWGGLDPHDKIVFPETMAVCPIKGDILHYICDTVEEHVKRNDNFSTLAAQSMHRIGKKTNWLKIFASPTWFFLNDYFLRAGFLNGRQGWMIAIHQAKYHYLKYAKLYRLQKTPAKVIQANGLNIKSAADADRLPRDVRAHI